MRAVVGCGGGLLLLALCAVLLPVLLVGGAAGAPGAAQPVEAAPVTGPGAPAAVGTPTEIAADGSCESPAVGRQRPAFPYVPPCGFPDSYVSPPGECTSWAAFNWPGHHGHGVTWGGDAWTWYANAAEQGYTTTSTPSVGAIAVFEQSGADAGAWGHVAVVLSTTSAQVTVSEMNFAGRFVVDVRSIPWPNAGVAGFIPVPADAGVGS